MNKAIIGKKLGMTQVFDENGLIMPVTVIKAGPCVVVQKKTNETDGYNAVKVGFEECKEKALNKPAKGQFLKLKTPTMRYVKELRLEDVSKYEAGSVIKAEDMFSAGDMVDVTGISKGKGYQGAQKRHGVSKGLMTHGSKYHRGVGSMGANSSPSRVFKGKKLPGRMGGEQVTVQNLSVVRVDADRGVILIKGATPGPKGAVIMVKEAVKYATKR